MVQIKGLSFPLRWIGSFAFLLTLSFFPPFFPQGYPKLPWILLLLFGFILFVWQLKKVEGAIERVALFLFLFST